MNPSVHAVADAGSSTIEAKRNGRARACRCKESGPTGPAFQATPWRCGCSGSMWRRE